MAKQTLKKPLKPRKGKASLVPRRNIAATLAEMERTAAATPKSAEVRALLRSWLTDESGYDEETWPELKKALERERHHAGARRLFDG